MAGALPHSNAMVEMDYEFTAPFVLDTSQHSTTFGQPGTPLAVVDTLERYRQRQPSYQQTALR